MNYKDILKKANHEPKMIKILKQCFEEVDVGGVLEVEKINNIIELISVMPRHFNFDENDFHDAINFGIKKGYLEAQKNADIKKLVDFSMF